MKKFPFYAPIAVLVVIGVKLKDCCYDVAGEEKPPALDLSRAEVSYEPPEFPLQALTVPNAAFKIKLIVICHLKPLLKTEAANR